MPTPVRLPRLSWGDPAAARQALLAHGLGSSGALMWRLASALADDGWHAVAVDLRGHGSAPRATDYTIAAYAADLAHTRPDIGGAWDAVIGHSLGGAASVTAAADDPDWAHRLVLIDPGIRLAPRARQSVRTSLERSLGELTDEAVRASHPHWHPVDVELKARATREVSRWAVEQTSVQNDPWDVRADAARLAVPTHVIGGDPRVHSIFARKLAADVLASNPLMTMSVVTGAGHSPHRDKPDETVRQLREALS